VTDYNAHTVVLLGSNTGNNDWVYVGSGERELSWSNTTATSGNHVSTVAIENTLGNMGFYRYHRLIVTKVTHQHLPVIFQLELFGVPEYDPEAYGTDVTIKSVANVPNTDWLEVYYDAKDLGNGAVTNPISGLGGTTNNGTAYGDTQISDGAFVFDGNGDYIETTVTTETGNWPHSYSFWMKADTDASSGAHFVALGTEGGAGSGTSVIRFSNDDVLWYFWSNDVYFKSSNLRGRWVHVVGTYDGGSAATSRKIFINNIEAPISSTAGTIGSLNLTTTSTPFKIGSKLDNTNTFKGSIANVRLFNRALTSDEIYQLYAYQKEYFGHSTNSMTLKAGRLGIGTSEPKAALDVRGTINANRFNTLVAEHTVTSTVNSVEFTGLDLFGDGGTYKILWKVKNPVSGNPQYYMTVNGDTTESNYWYGGKQHTNTEGLHDGNYPTIFRAGSESAHTLEITMTRSCDGYIVAHGQGTFHTGNGLSSGHVQGWELNRWFYKNPGNVTSILFSSANTSTGKYGSGSNIQIHKYM
jgi:hypothetical protein